MLRTQFDAVWHSECCVHSEMIHIDVYNILSVFCSS